MLAIIPARGGSKGLPGKNIRLLSGKPLIAYTIEAALKAKEITRVICSTDSPEIADVAVKFGAEVPFLRPAELASDNSLAIDTYIYTVKKITKNGSFINDFAILLPTSPLRNEMDIDNAIKIFREKNADSVISFYPAPHPFNWYCYIDDHGILQNIFSNNSLLKNRQDERQAYLPNGAIYIFNYQVLVEKRTYYTEKTFPYIMDRNRSIDIDTIDDFAYAEYLLSKKSPKV